MTGVALHVDPSRCRIQHETGTVRVSRSADSTLELLYCTGFDMRELKLPATLQKLLGTELTTIEGASGMPGLAMSQVLHPVPESSACSTC